MPTKKVRYTQPLLGEANPSGYLIAVPGASVLIRQNGVECDVFADNDGTAMTNPVPTGVPVGTAGVDVRGTLLVYLDPGSGYDGVATVGSESSTFPIPDISPDVADVQAPIESGTYAEEGGTPGFEFVTVEPTAGEDGVFALKGRYWGPDMGIGVPYVVPTGPSASQHIAFDLVTKGVPANIPDLGVAWIDICDSNEAQIAAEDYQATRIGKTKDGYGYVTLAEGDGGIGTNPNALPLVLQHMGGNVGIGAAAKAPAARLHVDGGIIATQVAAAGLTGATASSRYVGGTASGAPTTGTFAIGDYVIDRTGKIWICTVAGTPGTWVQGGGADATKVPLVQTQTAGTALNVYKVQPSNAARGPFNFTVFDDGAGNHVGYWGYNAAEQGGKFLSTEHAFKWVHESAFGGWNESYTEYLSPDGTVNFRPWFFVIDKTTNVVQAHDFVGPPFAWKTIPGVVIADLTASGVFRTYGPAGTDPSWQIHAAAGRQAGFSMYAAGVQNFLLSSVDNNLTILRQNTRNIVQIGTSAAMGGIGLGDIPNGLGGVVSVKMDSMIEAGVDAGKYYAAFLARGCASPRFGSGYSNDLARYENFDGSAVYSRVSPNGYPMNRKTAAPADAEIANGEMALWFDSTNGAAKLMVKAKQADGTVRTGSLALT